MLMVTRNGTADSKGTVLVAAVMPNENCYCSNQKTYRWCYRYGGAIDDFAVHHNRLLMADSWF